MIFMSYISHPHLPTAGGGLRGVNTEYKREKNLNKPKEETYDINIS